MRRTLLTALLLALIAGLAAPAVDTSASEELAALVRVGVAPAAGSAHRRPFLVGLLAPDAPEN